MQEIDEISHLTPYQNGPENRVMLVCEIYVMTMTGVKASLADQDHHSD
jgi:hypothetical protein